MNPWMKLLASMSLSAFLASSAYALNPAPGNGTTGQFSETIRVDSTNRSYTVHVPSHYLQSEKLPLVVDLHGFLSTSSQQRSFSGYHELHDDPEEGFVIVYPQGISNSWNAGTACCGTAASQNLNDVGFIRNMVEAILLKWPKIDRSRIYVTGLSNGSAMTQRLAVEASDLFAAGAGYALMLLTPAPADRQPMPYINFHGYDDNIVRYSGSSMFPSVEQNTANWANLNQCTGTPQIEQLNPAGTAAKPNVCVHYEDCADGSEVVSCSINAGHIIYTNPGNIDVTQKGWDFMKRFSR